MRPTRQDPRQNSSFAIGFFSFHYIRAVNENNISLQGESLRILKTLIGACQLDISLLNSLNCSRKMKYSDFLDNVFRKVLAALGDSLGPTMQQWAELGFGQAAVYAGFVGILNATAAEPNTRCLTILENWLSQLNKSSQLAGISETSRQPLIEAIILLQHSKTYSTTYQCMKILKLALRNNLIFKT